MGYLLNARGIALVVLASAGAATATADPTPIDVTALRPTMLLLEDGKRHYLVYAHKPGEDLMRASLFYGDGKTFRLVADGANGRDKSNVLTWAIVDERYYSLMNQVEGDISVGRLAVKCDKRVAELRKVAPEAAAKILASATFTAREPPRIPTLLARDDEANYYYVDLPYTAPNAPLSSDYQVYAGKRGAMRHLEIKEQAVDTAGLLFITNAGTLKWTIKTNAMSWIAPKKPPLELTVADAFGDRKLVYGALGVYSTQRFGTPCDDL